MTGIVALRRPEAVVFDFDGVIVDTEPLHYKAFQKVLEPLGLGFPWQDYVDIFMGFDDRDAFREAFRVRGRNLDPGRLGQLVDAKSLVFQDIIRDGVSAYPGAVATIESLSASGLPMSICSGALRSDILPILTRLGIAGCFRHIVTADDVRKSKPDPECYALAYQRLSLAYPSLLTTPGKSLAVEDTPAGIQAAKRAGLKVLAVTNSYSGRDLAEADSITDSLENIRWEGVHP